jgi:hypothetical protein
MRLQQSPWAHLYRRRQHAVSKRNVPSTAMMVSPFRSPAWNTAERGITSLTTTPCMLRLFKACCSPRPSLPSASFRTSSVLLTPHTTNLTSCSASRIISDACSCWFPHRRELMASTRSPTLRPAAGHGMRVSEGGAGTEGGSCERTRNRGSRAARDRVDEYARAAHRCGE